MTCEPVTLPDGGGIRRGALAAILAGLVLAAAACSGDIRRGTTDAADASAPDGEVDTGDGVPDGDGFSDAGGDTADATDADVASDTDDADAEPLRGPPYPIVLAHGFGGFEHLADVKAVPYFYKIPQALRKHGEVVLVTEVAPFDDSMARGEQLLKQIETFAENERWKKVHIIGHSQGGLDARYVAHHRPDLVASVVTIATPNHGTRVADIALELADRDLTKKIVNELAEILGRALYDSSGNETAVVDALRQFSEPGIKKFNRKITNRMGVYYASVGGRSDRHLGGSPCKSQNRPKFIEDWDLEIDPVDPILSVTESVLDGPAGTRPNDGMVTVQNSRWGEFLGCIPADHFDEVGQLLGDEPGLINDWDYLEFYRKLADFLHKRE